MFLLWTANGSVECEWDIVLVATDGIADVMDDRMVVQMVTPDRQTHINRG